MPALAENEMKAKAGLPERVRLNEGLGVTVFRAEVMAAAAD